MARQPLVTVDQIERALIQSGGIPLLAAQRLGVSRSLIVKAIKRSPKLQASRNEAVENTLDLAEGTLVNAIRQGDLRATIYFLNCKGRSRGWGRQFIPPPKAQNDAPVAELVSKNELSLLKIMSVEELEDLERRLIEQRDLHAPPTLELKANETDGSGDQRGSAAAG